MLGEPVGDRGGSTRSGRETRRKILVAASRVFADRGYLATEAQDIYRAANVGRGAFYHHFRPETGTSEGGPVEQVAYAVVQESMITDLVPRAVLPRLQAVVDASILLAVATPRVTKVRAALRIALEQGHPLYGFLWSAYIPAIGDFLTESRDLRELLPGVEPRRAAEDWVDGYTGRDARYRLSYRDLPAAIARLNESMVRLIAEPHVARHLDLSVERGITLFETSPWAGMDESEPGLNDAGRPEKAN
ncbi:TetR/AcrR family transcriptional regulator [Streptomyces sp. NBC_00882]|uniref:TetR family transcriptional regulator n=1 Tax=Streptomyces sp. NBC_00882 TaxID=2975856 RepID=UPI00386B40B7|nr:TetR/AcrR family transcriptional regulator [Streptomyces sp. NBC_00882]